MSEIATLRPTVPATQDGGGAEALPNNIEAEQQLLGAILVNNDIYDRIAALVRSEHFFDPVHARIFEIASARIQKNALASPVTLKAFMEDDSGLRDLGGPAYLVRLAGSAISSFAARDYAQMIYDLAVRRELIQLGRDISDRAAKVDMEYEPREQITEADADLLSAQLKELRLRAFPPSSLKELRKFSSGEAAKLIGVTDAYIRHLSLAGDAPEAEKTALFSRTAVDFYRLRVE